MHKLDAAGRTLIAAAYLMEEAAFNGLHPLHAVRAVTNRSDTYCKAAQRLLECNGHDLLDLTTEEKIDILVAAAYF